MGDPIKPSGALFPSLPLCFRALEAYFGMLKEAINANPRVAGVWILLFGKLDTMGRYMKGEAG